MPDKKKLEAEKPLHTIRCGQIVATIEERQSNAGFSYFQYEIGRKWLVKSSQTEESGAGLFAHQEAEVLETVQAACAYIRDRENGRKEGGKSQPVHSGSNTASGDSSDA